MTAPTSGQAPIGDQWPSVDAEPTPGPWEYVASTEHHGPYVTTQFGSTICDFYVMSEPRERSTASGGTSKPIHHMNEMADANARIAAAAWEMMAILEYLAASAKFACDWPYTLNNINSALGKATGKLPDRSEPTQSQSAR